MKTSEPTRRNCGRSLQGVQVSASRRSGTTDELGPDEPEPEGSASSAPEASAGPEDSGGSDLLAALLDGMDAALCAFDADGVVTHWNREAERILGWSAAEAVGRKGFAGWAVRSADAGGGGGGGGVARPGARRGGAGGPPRGPGGGPG